MGTGGVACAMPTARVEGVDSVYVLAGSCVLCEGGLMDRQSVCWRQVWMTACVLLVFSVTYVCL
jgi:hypothetical protein